MQLRYVSFTICTTRLQALQANLTIVDCMPSTCCKPDLALLAEHTWTFRPDAKSIGFHNAILLTTLRDPKKGFLSDGHFKIATYIAAQAGSQAPADCHLSMAGSGSACLAGHAAAVPDPSCCKRWGPEASPAGYIRIYALL